MQILIAVGLLLVIAGLVFILRVLLRARRLARSPEAEDANAAFRRLVLENGIGLGLAFLGMALLVAAGILG
ncbi:MAG: hypothetical protein AAGE90_05370 [Pseudomonadota bacterium]